MQTIVSLPSSDPQSGPWSLREVSQTAATRTFTGDGRPQQTVIEEYVNGDQPGTEDLVTTTVFITDLSNAYSGWVQSIAHADGRMSYFQYTNGIGGVATNLECVRGTGRRGRHPERPANRNSDRPNRSRPVPHNRGDTERRRGHRALHESRQYATTNQDYSVTDVLANLTTSYHCDCAGYPRSPTRKAW